MRSASFPPCIQFNYDDRPDLCWCSSKSPLDSSRSCCWLAQMSWWVQLLPFVFFVSSFFMSLLNFIFLRAILVGCFFLRPHHTLVFLVAVEFVGAGKPPSYPQNAMSRRPKAPRSVLLDSTPPPPFHPEKPTLIAAKPPTPTTPTLFTPFKWAVGCGVVIQIFHGSVSCDVSRRGVVPFTTSLLTISVKSMIFQVIRPWKPW